jgi:hypothetical protein
MEAIRAYWIAKLVSRSFLLISTFPLLIRLLSLINRESLAFIFFKIRPSTTNVSPLPASMLAKMVSSID